MLKPKLTHRQSRGLVLTLLVGGLSVLLLSGQGGTVPPIPPIPLSGVSVEALAQDGETLFPPRPGELPPKITANEAQDIAATEGPFGTLPVREAVLAHLLTEHFHPTIDRLVWVVSYDHSAVDFPVFMPTPERYRTLFALTFIDARTGEYLLATSPGVPVPSQ